MANELILLDTSVLIDYFRKKDKHQSYLFKIASSANYKLAISVITEFEVLLGSNSEQQGFWDDLFSNFTILDLDSSCIRQAIRVQQTLKPKNQMIDIPDLFIAATDTSGDIAPSTRIMGNTILT